MPASPFSRQVLDELVLMLPTPGLVDGLIETLVNDICASLESLPKLTAEDPKAAAREAHRLKSGAGSLGATRLQRALAELDWSLRWGEPGDALELVPQFVAAAEEVLAWVSSEAGARGAA